ncbi:alpha/beta hydrolase [Roseibium sp. AS2]|uniref:alpha/beta fold hydrolase n=1 Tax=Roseibium sp. AS2 TaxID=3135781 RepID=UPI003178B344
MSENLLYIRDEGTGRPVVLLHGWACPGRFLEGQIDALKADARCIVPDLPGHGNTGDRLPLTIEASADALHDYLCAQDLREVVLCGWSMGALVVYSLIERHGAERVSCVVTIDMSPKVLNDADWPYGTSNGLTREINTVVLETMVAEWPGLPARIARRLFAAGHPVDPELMAFAQDEIAKGDPVLLRRMWASLTEQDFRTLLRAFPVPLHLAAGAGSQLYNPAMIRWHRDNVPEIHVHEFAQSGHSPHLEEPQAFNRLLLDLLHG